MLLDTLKARFPENTWQGQCGIFAHRVVEFPSVGNRLREKIRSVQNFGIPREKINLDFREGDVLITQESKFFGHVAIINLLIYAENTPNLIAMQLTESNYFLNGRVHHTRIINANDPDIAGIIRGNLLV